jgi:hypothetical protein
MVMRNALTDLMNRIVAWLKPYAKKTNSIATGDATQTDTDAMDTNIVEMELMNAGVNKDQHPRHDHHLVRFFFQ